MSADAPEPADPREEPLDDALHDQIALRAYEISQSAEAGTDEENWFQAERELQTAEPSPEE